MSVLDCVSMAVNYGISVVVLAGGLSRRLGRDKALEPFGEETLLHRVVRRAIEALGADDAVIVVAEEGQSERAPVDLPHRVVVDALPRMGTLGGIYTGLGAARNDWAIMVACDMPFLSGELLRYMAGLRDGVDAVVPLIGERPEPTHALYSRQCLGAIRDRLEAEQLKASGFLEAVRVRYVEEDEARRLDRELLSFFNVNRPEDLARAVQIAGREGIRGAV